MVTLFFFVGLILGSFLNVVLARIRTEETLMGRSYCRNCRKQIAWFDNIPVISFLVLRGKCRTCRDSISPRYLLVEVGTGILFALVGWIFFDALDPLSWSETMLVLGVVTFALIIALYDAKYYEIPMTVMWIMIAYIIIFTMFLDYLSFSSFRSFWDLGLYQGMIAGLLAFTFFYLLSVISHERWMGYGDAYVAFAIGLLLGGDTYGALVLAFVLGSIYGLIHIAFGKKNLSSQVPFAPFLLAGMLIMLFLGEIIGLLFVLPW